MCKHVAAVLYGVGARLDARPELLFELRGVDGSELIARAGTGLPLAKKGPAPERALAEEGLSELFGIDLAEAPAAPGPRSRRRSRPDPRLQAVDQSPGRRAVRDREAPGGGDLAPGLSAARTGSVARRADCQSD